MNVDPILALQSLGYTEREAAFLYLVAVHSGYFLRRQFDYFIDRQRGAIAQHFLEKARVAGHIEVIDYGESRYVYHLFAKPIYRMLGNAESQNRRRKGDGTVHARLIALDYVLENDGQHYLVSDAEKVRFFAESRAVPPQVFSGPDRKIFSSLGSFPVAVADRTQPATSLVRFLFADEVLLTTEKFRRFLTVAGPLLRAVGNFEVIYASSSAHNFPAAKEDFWKHFAPAVPAKQGVLGDGWRQEPVLQDARPAPSLHPKFTTLLLKYNYPRIRRKEPPSLRTVRRFGPSQTLQVTATDTDEIQKGSGMG